MAYTCASMATQSQLVARRPYFGHRGRSSVRLMSYCGWRGEITLLTSVPLFIEYDAKCVEK
jgi:hypothetical protein